MVADLIFPMNYQASALMPQFPGDIHITSGFADVPGV